MPYPTPVVEIAFNDGPYVANPTWTDVTSYVKRMSINRGRSNDWGDFNGNATVVLNNRTRLFDPFYTSGTYYGKLLPRKQIRISATTVETGLTTDILFRGFIDGFSPEWTDAGTDSTVTLNCFDALQLLASSPMPADWSTAYINTLSPDHFWKFDDPIIGSGTAATLTDYGSRACTFTSSTTIYQSPNLGSGIESTSVGSQQLINTGAASVFSTPWGSSTDFSASVWTRNNQVSANGSNIVFATNGWYFQLAQITSGATAGQYRLRMSNTSVGYEWFTTQAYTTNEPIHVGFTYTAATGTGTIYVNGLADTGSRSSIGALFGAYTNEQLGIGNGEFQHFSTFSSVLSAVQISTIYQYGLQQFSETTGARVNRVIGFTPFPASLVSANGTTSILDFPLSARTGTDQLRLAATTEYGPLFVNRQGTIVQMKQNAIWSDTKSIVSQVTYGQGGQKIGEDVLLSYDGDSIRNKAQITMSGGGTVEKTNASSVTNYGEAVISVATGTGSATEANQIASLTSGFGGVAYPTTSPLDVVISPSDAWKPTMQLDLNERVTLKIAPQIGNVVTIPVLVQSIRHDVLPGFWQTTLEGSARWAAVFILNQSTLGGTDLLG